MLLVDLLKRALGNLKRDYYQWRYWNNLIRTMKRYTVELDKNHERENIPYINKPGIAFSFDDSFRVHHWNEYGKDMFGYYDVKVTFNINAYHHFEEQREHTQQEIDILLDLQSFGHEIAHHGYKHKRATSYSKGKRKWIEEEIISLIEWMKNQSHSVTNEKFKMPVSFAFPYFKFGESDLLELIPDYFKIVRGHLFQENLTPFDHTGFAPSICIDRNFLLNKRYIKKVIKIAHKSGKNLILTCHSLLPEEINWKEFGWKGEEEDKAGNWRISPKMIQYIIKEGRKNNMEFYTTSEIAGVANFIDPNFERYVRERILQTLEKWIPISELMSVKELDLSNVNISNLDGIQYFYNLEKLKLGSKGIRGLKLIEKLPYLKSLHIPNNSGVNDITLVKGLTLIENINTSL
jgi:peptidoglycan/xylan/chitin deacetylase (PgdA/CDA1 family)